MVVGVCRLGSAPGARKISSVAKRCYWGIGRYTSRRNVLATNREHRHYDEHGGNRDLQHLALPPSDKPM